jgi:putative hydrolase of HD superfamily
MLHDSPQGQLIERLFKEYEDGETAEARFVKDLDRLEMAIQATEYERRLPSEAPMDLLQPFFDSSIPNIRHPEVREWGADLMKERETQDSR